VLVKASRSRLGKRLRLAYAASYSEDPVVYIQVGGPVDGEEYSYVPSGC
jgi:hypothetical protein